MIDREELERQEREGMLAAERYAEEGRRQYREMMDRRRAEALAARARELPVVSEEATFEERARAYEGLALDALARVIMDNKTPQAVVAAAREVLDRARGKATQEVRVDHRTDGILAMLTQVRELRSRMYEPVPALPAVDGEVVEI